jgi:glycosyltransferase involved in cell wall biosynthesis
MHRGHRVAVVMPAFNVEAFVGAAVRSVPGYVDHVVVVDDASSDRTPQVLGKLRRRGLLVVRHAANRGVGAAIATGYAEALRLGAQVVAVMAGDGQMDPADLGRLLDPIVSGQADYAKGNRFLHREVWRAMPPLRLVGNVLLSLLTKICSGYARVFDSQCGYTAISRAALEAIGLRLFARYGYPNDLLARLRVVGARVAELPVRPIYSGQPSGIRALTFFYPILFVLLRSLGWRIFHQRLRPLLGAPSSRRLGQGPAVEEGDADRPCDHLLPAPRN